MQKNQYEKLMEAAENSAYMSIAINADGTPVNGGFVPWERTVSAFNMKTPKVTMAAEDLQNKTIRDALKRCRLMGCYIFTELTDYRFLSELTELRDLFIRHGETIKDLSFLEGLSRLFLFYLENAALPDLEMLVNVCKKGDRLPGKCFGFFHCQISDTSALSEIDFLVSELLVWPVKGDVRERWNTPNAPGVFRFYDT